MHPLAAEVHALLAALPRAVPDDARPLLDAGVADVLRALDDAALLRLCAPGLRDLLTRAEAEAAPPALLPAPVAAPEPAKRPKPPCVAPAPASGTQARRLTLLVPSAADGRDLACTNLDECEKGFLREHANDKFYNSHATCPARCEGRAGRAGRAA